MTNFNSKILISEDLLNKCMTFAKSSVSSSLDKYAYRHNFDINDPLAVERAIDKFSKDICCGKIGEELVYSIFSEKIPGLSKPDYNIYSKKDKSWSSDLKDKDSLLSIAVKSQDIRSSINYGDSWVFQIGDGKKDMDKEIFKNYNEHHYVSFVSLNVPKRSGQIRAMVKTSWLHNNKLFKNMVKDSLRSNKVAVYLENLEEYNKELWQL